MQNKYHDSNEGFNDRTIKVRRFSKQSHLEQEKRLFKKKVLSSLAEAEYVIIFNIEWSIMIKRFPVIAIIIISTAVRFDQKQFEIRLAAGCFT